MEEYGSILQSINKNKKVIAVPRLHQYQEHVNDHQRQIIEFMRTKGYIIGISGVEQLEQAIMEIDNFQPKKYERNNEKMLKIIEDFIENCK